MEDKRFDCKKCESSNTFFSGEGYNQSKVCKSCGSEEHTPNFREDFIANMIASYNKTKEK